MREITRRTFSSVLAACVAAPVAARAGNVFRPAPASALADDAVWLPASHDKWHEWRVRTASIGFPFRKTYFTLHNSLGHVRGGSDLDRQVFYGDPWRSPNEMVGLASLYGTCDRGRAQSAANVLDGGHRGHRLSSAYVVVWSPETIFLAHANDQRDVAIIPKDWRYVARVANIGPDSDVPALITRALFRFPTLGRRGEARVRIYFGPNIAARLGPTYREIPCREVAQLRDDEPLVI